MAVLIGGLIVAIGTCTFAYAGFLLIRKEVNFENVFVFGSWWIALSLIVYHVSRLTDLKGFLIRALSIVALLVGMVVIDATMTMSDNPITIFLMVVFWNYVIYTLAPKFFSQYRLVIVGVYGLSFTIFIYYRLFTTSYEHNEAFIIPLFLLPIPVFILLWFYEQWRWFQNLKAEKSQAEMALLRSQVNPHFFFNTLNNLYSLSVNQSTEAPEVILKLSDVMRYTIYEGEKETVALSSEVTYMENYLELHKIRQHKGIETSFEKEIDGQPMVAPLLFIVLLENSIKHGVESMTENAFIHMSLKADETMIEFRIENNYEMPEEIQTGGIGLNNLKKRLKLLYPDLHNLEQHATEDLHVTKLIIYPA